MLGLLCTYAQRKFPYHIAHVESNDDLYGGAPGYMFELSQNIATCVQEIVKQLTAIGERSDAASKLCQARLVLDLVNQISTRMEMSVEVGEFLLRLLELAAKSKSVYTRTDLKYLSNTIEFVKNKASGSAAANTLIPALRGV